MNAGNDMPDDLRPLGLAKGYLISADGRVFNERKRHEIKSVTRAEAEQKCCREAKPNSPTGNAPHTGGRNPRLRSGVTELVFSDEVVELQGPPAKRREIRTGRFIEVTHWVLMLPRDFEHGATFAGGGTADLVGDGEHGWYILTVDGRLLIFHGRSIAAQMYSRH